MSVQAADACGKPIAMCGDMAGDPRFTWVLLGLGLRSLSMAPRQIPIVKVEEVMSLRTEDEIEDVVNRTMKARFPLEFTDEN